MLIRILGCTRRQQYSHGRTALLAIQVDAAINSGNSGGPVLLGDRVVGIAFQCLTSGDNIGYIIPVPVINHFLEDLRRNSGKYTGGWSSLHLCGSRLMLPAGLMDLRYSMRKAALPLCVVSVSVMGLKDRLSKNVVV